MQQTKELPATNLNTSCAVMLESCLRTTNALGSCPALSSGTPTTAASATPSQVSNRSSSSAGDTWDIMFE